MISSSAETGGCTFASLMSPLRSFVFSALSADTSAPSPELSMKLTCDMSTTTLRAPCSISCSSAVRNWGATSMSTLAADGLITIARPFCLTSISITIIVIDPSASPEQPPPREEPDHVGDGDRQEHAPRERHPWRRLGALDRVLDAGKPDDRQDEHAVADVAEHRVLPVVDEQLQRPAALQDMNHDEETEQDEDAEPEALEHPRECLRLLVRAVLDRI